MEDDFRFVQDPIERTRTGSFDDPEIARQGLHETYSCDGHITMSPDFQDWFNRYLDESLGIDNKGIALNWWREGIQTTEIAERLCFKPSQIQKWINDEVKRQKAANEAGEEILPRRPWRPRSHASYASLAQQVCEQRPRAFQVLLDLAAGRSRTDIALKLGLSERSIGRLLGESEDLTGVSWRELRSHVAEERDRRALQRFEGMILAGYSITGVCELLDWDSEFVDRLVELLKKAGKWKRLLTMASFYGRSECKDATSEPDESGSSSIQSDFARPEASRWNRRLVA